MSTGAPAAQTGAPPVSASAFPGDSQRGRTALLFAVFAAVVLLAKLPTLNVPAYWDEMGYVAQAGYLAEGSLVRALPGFRAHRAFWGHPPGLQLTLAVVFKAVGHSMIAAHLLIAAFALAGVWFTFLLGRELRDESTGLLAAALLFVSPLYFAQAGMFLADLPVAALGVACIYFGLRGRLVAYVLAAGFMVLIKETGVAMVAAWVLYAAVTRPPLTRAGLARLAVYALPLVGLAIFLVLQKHATGRFVFQYGFAVDIVRTDRATVTPNFVFVTQWIFLHQLRWVFTAIIALALLSGRMRDRRPLFLFGAVLLCYGYAFCFLYFLPRYLLPVLPFFFLLAAASLADLIRQPARAGAALALIALAVASLLAQPYRGNAEFNLRYLDGVRAHEAMAEYVVRHASDAWIVTRWPHTRQLLDPRLGYVERPLRVLRDEDDSDLTRTSVAVVSWPGDDEMEALRARLTAAGWRRLGRWGGAEPGVEVYGSAPGRPAVSGEAQPAS